MQDTAAVAAMPSIATLDQTVPASSYTGWLAAPWSWSCVLMVSFSECRTAHEALDRVLLVAPSLKGLELLGQIDAKIDSMSLVFPPDGPSSAPQLEIVRRVASRKDAHSPGLERLAMHCVSGRVFLVGESEPEEVDERTYWSSGARYIFEKEEPGSLQN